jgi:hypothetical protein
MDARYDVERADMDEKLATLVRGQELILASWTAIF